MNNTIGIINLCKDTELCDTIKRLLESLLIKTDDINKTIHNKCNFIETISLEDEINSYNSYIKYVNEIIKILIEFINYLNLDNTKLNINNYTAIYINLSQSDKLFICNYEMIIKLIQTMINNLIYYETIINELVEIINDIDLT